MTAIDSLMQLKASIPDATALSLLIGAERNEEPGYDHHRVDITKEVGNHFAKSATRVVDRIDTDLPPVPFQPGDRLGDGRLVYLAPGEIPGIDGVIAGLAQANLPWFTGDEEVQNRLRYYVIKVEVAGEPAYFFRRMSEKQELTKKGFAAKLAGHRFTAFHDRVFLFDAGIDFVVYQGYTFLITKKVLQDLFKEEVRAAFAERAKPAVEAILTQLPLANPEHFQETVDQDERMSGALVRIHEKGGLGKLTPDWVRQKNDLLQHHKLNIEGVNGSTLIHFDGNPRRRFILIKILEEKVNQGELTGTTWVTGSHVPG
jgi:hypothetical protein